MECATRIDARISDFAVATTVRTRAALVTRAPSRTGSIGIGRTVHRDRSSEVD